MSEYIGAIIFLIGLLLFIGTLAYLFWPVIGVTGVLILLSLLLMIIGMYCHNYNS